MKRFYTIGLAAVTAGLLMSASTVMAQGFGGGGGGRGNFDPEAMRARMAEMMKERLKASDEEWKVIQPLLEDVQSKQRESMTGRFGGMRGMFGGPGGQGGPPDAQRGENQRQRRGAADTRRGGEGSEEVAALSAALESESTPAAEIKAKLQAVRDSRKKAESELKASRDKLRGVLTTRQEAQLVLMGVLD